VSYKKQEPRVHMGLWRVHMGLWRCVCWVSVAHRFSFCFVGLRSVSCVHFCSFLCIGYSLLPPRFSLMVIYCLLEVDFLNRQRSTYFLYINIFLQYWPCKVVFSEMYIPSAYALKSLVESRRLWYLNAVNKMFRWRIYLLILWISSLLKG
jgi:hypothetical protein